jgi:hypothetical protein
MKKKSLIEKHCLYCGKLFLPNSPSVKTCCKEHGYLYRSTTSQKPIKMYRICKVCGGVFKDPTYSRKTCSKECDKSLKEQTTMERFGVKNIMHLEEVKQKYKHKKDPIHVQKMKNTWRKKSKEEIQEIVKKREETSIKVYGVSNVFKSKEIQTKIKQTNLKNLGVEFPTQSKKVLDKRESRFEEKHGVKNPMQVQEIQKKQQNKIFEKFGVMNASQINISEEVLKFFENRENLRVLYEDNKFSSVYIANKFGVSSSYVLLKLKEHNIPARECGASCHEEEIKDFLKSLNVITEKRRKSLLPSGKEIDIYLPEFKIGIEFNGVYWHQEQVLRGYGKNGKTYHLDKTEEAEMLGVQLIHIYEDDWLYKKNIVKERLKSILKKSSFIFFGRKCKLKEISFKEKQEFINKHHLQGDCPSSINIGLYSEENLVAVMTFSKLRKSLGQIAKEGDYELLRYCSTGNVIGGASKLFSYFLKKYSPKRVISYADRHWTASFTQNMYDKLNFKKISDGEPNYWYVIKDKRVHRYNYRKTELHKKLKVFDPSLTEYQNMLLNKYDRIWGCGSLKYEYIVV